VLSVTGASFFSFYKNDFVITETIFGHSRTKFMNHEARIKVENILKGSLD